MLVCLLQRRCLKSDTAASLVACLENEKQFGVPVSSAVNAAAALIEEQVGYSLCRLFRQHDSFASCADVKVPGQYHPSFVLTSAEKSSFFELRCGLIMSAGICVQGLDIKLPQRPSRKGGRD
jgi:hypothetical protein